MAEGWLRAAAREVGAVEHKGKVLEQKGDDVGYGAIPLSRKHSRLPVDLRGNGYGDVSDGSHVLDFLDWQGFALPLISSVRRKRVIICKVTATNFAIVFGLAGRTIRQDGLYLQRVIKRRSSVKFRMTDIYKTQYKNWFFDRLGAGFGVQGRI
jgi:hypothetical protein